MALTGKAALAGVMGWPIAHSLSPRLHGFWLAEHGIREPERPLQTIRDMVGAVRYLLSSGGFAWVTGKVRPGHRATEQFPHGAACPSGDAA